MPRTAGSQNQENLKYQKLYNWGRTLITSGVIKNQDKFPSEHILQKKFGYSRQTVRNALDRLEKDGLIDPGKREAVPMYRMKTAAQMANAPMWD